jgi:CRP/FNR family transcriptional regulator, cyclic AMP receptor protein
LRESAERPVSLAKTFSEPVTSSSLHLREIEEEAVGGANFFAKLSANERARIASVSILQSFAEGEAVFVQDGRHDGIFIILSGQVRVYYTGPSGREITLAYWSPGNFIGGPDIFGGSRHMWSGQAEEATQVLHVPGRNLRELAEQHPWIALALIDAMAEKGKCFSAVIQMLGTRSAAERLAQLLVLMADLGGRRVAEGVMIGRKLTQEELAKMVGSTRQWVSATLDRFREAGLIEVTQQSIVIRDVERMRDFGC